ncbi:MAG: endonuclease III [Hyphomicrobiaceae bacterium]
MVTKKSGTRQAAHRPAATAGVDAAPGHAEGKKRRATPVAAASKASRKAVASGAKPGRRPRFKPLDQAEVAEIFRRFHDIEPAPKGELEHTNPFTLLVAVVLSAQATDAGVNKATRGLFARADTPAAMLALGEEQVREAIRTIGLYRNKAKHVIALCAKLVADYGGEVPRDRDLLETLPGVGRKTANVVMNVAFGAPTNAVDTHVFRVAHRLGLSRGKTPAAVEKDLDRLIPPQYGVPAHHWLILHGRYLCKARKPECYRCPIADICRFEPKTPAVE